MAKKFKRKGPKEIKSLVSKIKRKGRASSTVGHKGLSPKGKAEAVKNMKHFAYREKLFTEYQKAPKPKFSKAFKTAAKKKAAKSLAKSVVGKMVPPLGVALAATEVYKAGKKGLKDRKSRISCEKKGGVWKKGYCITRSSKKKK